MITCVVLFCCIFAAGNLRKSSINQSMTKTKYQESAMSYAKDYLDRLLDMEDMLGHNVSERIDKLVEQRFMNYLKEREESLKKQNDETDNQ